MNGMLQTLVCGMSRQSVQIAAVFGIIAGATWLLRRRSAHWRYMLWLVVLVKCVTPPVAPVKLALLPVKPESSPVIIKPATVRQEPPAVSPIAHKWATEKPPTETKGTQHPGIAYSPEPNASTEPVAPVAAGNPAAPLPAVPSSTFFTAHPVWGLYQWLGLAWIAGAAGFGLYVLARGWWIHTHLRRLRRPVGESLRREIAALSQTMGLKRRPQAWLVDGYSQPFVWGLWRGSLFLPGDFEELSIEARRQILSHELAHIVRCDAAVNAVQLWVQSLFFFHPLVWWANRQLRREREKCCDEIAIATRIVQPKVYSAVIVDALLRDRTSKRAMPGLAVAGPVKNLEERIKTILTPGRRFFRRPTFTAVLTVLLLAAVVAPTALTLTARAENRTKTPAITTKNPECTVTFPSGASVELLAVKKYHSRSNKWWRPSGERITDASFKTSPFYGTPPSNVTNAYEFILRVNEKENEQILTNLKVKQGERSWNRGHRTRVEGWENLHGFIASVPMGEKAITLQLDVAHAPWETRASMSGKEPGTKCSRGDTIVFMSAIPSRSYLIMNVSDDIGYIERRIIAVDTHGKIHPAKGHVGYVRNGKLCQSISSFPNLSLDDVREFRFQTKPVEWIQFQNVSCAPGEKQHVTITSQKETGNRGRRTSKTTSGMKKNPSSKLQRKIPKLDLNTTSFEDAMGYLQAVSNVSIVVNYDEINAGIKRAHADGSVDLRNVPIRVHRNNVTVRDALRSILDHAGNKTGVSLGYILDGARVVVLIRDDSKG